MALHSSSGHIPPVEPCTCAGYPTHPRCHGCATNAENGHGHVAELRGAFWITCIVFERPAMVRQPWQDTPRGRALAARCVIDLTKPEDGEMYERMLDRALVGARRRWKQLQDPAKLEDLLKCRRPGKR